MAFADQKSLKERSAGMAGAIILPATLGAIFISGLAVKEIVIPAPPPDIDTFDVDDKPPPPPDEVVEPKPQTDVISAPPKAPDRPFDLPAPDFPVKPIEQIPSIGGEVIPFALPLIETGPSLGAIEPAIATPRNHPGGWVTDSDYRSSWINRGWTGIARFELQVSVRGRVTDCRITRSTGHSALDNATCDLIARRARFEPAKDSTGQAVSGTYSSAISWELPD